MARRVDPLFRTKPSRQWPYTQARHLVCDTTDELLSLARRIGLKPDWIQDRASKWEHFDLTPAKRLKAIKLGAREVTRREMVETWRGR